ncbi:hypothetical protein R84981_003011 [Carnimonas sp. R-84981]|uniref:P63C domain-containing protein n=1 Tax=Carnimonas bestiolae TaxID=3402172 RepID=UPI003EDC60EC
MENNGKSAGGIARAKSLSPARKSEIAKKAAMARWGKLPQALKRGNFKDDFGIDVDCYVIDDENRTAVISQRGMAAALGLSVRGNAFLRFANSKMLAPFLGAEVKEKIEKPLKFQWTTTGAEALTITVNGYDVTLLIDICKSVVKAHEANALSVRQLQAATQASAIINGSAKLGIQHLVYKLTGYDATKEQTVAAFKMFVRREAREYEREFPEQLYDEWYRLYNITRPVRNRPWKFKHLTVDQVYWPLARSNGRVYQLTQAQKDRSTERNKRLHQFLSDVGVKALRQQVGQLLGIARISKNQEEYELFFKKLFGDQPDMFD